jgi:hypothetical protein
MKYLKMLFTYTFVILCLSSVLFSQQDVKLILTKSSLDEALLSVTEARAANFGDRIHTIFADNFS